MDYYLKGDPRFNVKTKNKRKIIYSWVTKEFKNLTRLYDAGVTVPKPITSANNVLLIEFIGDDDGNPAQPVKNQPPQNPEEFWNKLLVQLKMFVNDAKLVHGDLSNYNILNLNEEPVIIDVSQSVVLDNPISKELLERDINTLVREYTKLGVETSFEEVWEYIGPKILKLILDFRRSYFLHRKCLEVNSEKIYYNINKLYIDNRKMRRYHKFK